MAKNPIHHDRTKHMEIAKHFIKEKIDNGAISVTHVSPCNQKSNIITKALPINTFEDIKSNLGMIDIYHPD